jgi:hypothetical protein
MDSKEMMMAKIVTGRQNRLAVYCKNTFKRNWPAAAAQLPEEPKV